MLAQKKKSIKVTTADLTELVKGGMEGIEEEISKLSETMEAVLGELQTMKEPTTTSKTQTKKDIPTKKDGMTMSKEEMKALCKARSLKVSGTKAELAERLIADDVKNGQVPPATKKIRVHRDAYTKQPSTNEKRKLNGN